MNQSIIKQNSVYLINSSTWKNQTRKENKKIKYTRTKNYWYIEGHRKRYNKILDK